VTIWAQVLFFFDRVHAHMRLKHPKEAFKCKKTVCSAYFKTKTEANQHFEATHTSDKNAGVLYFSCSDCKFQTRWRHNLENHIAIKHFPRTHKCPECPKMFSSEDHIQEHARKTHSKNRKKCPHCGMTPALYNTHVVNTKCLKCCEPFKCFTLVKRHKSTCKLSFKCDICSKVFPIESSLLQHFENAHRKFDKNMWLGARKHSKSAFKCKDCKIYFAHEGFFNSHHRNLHKDCKKLTCHFCEKLVRCKSILEHHLIRVHGVLLPQRKL
jgi:KRAB domain-containing zinc finger protein